jgi:lipopolysaccharide export system protein LptA
MGVSGLSRLFLVAAACLFPGSILADAYLSEDDILYSADTYRVNYQDRIIHALGNAAFRRGPVAARAETIVIHYAPDRKTAFLQRRVRVHHRERGITVTGSSGELRYLQEYALVSGDARFEDGERVIESRRIESERWEVHRFTGAVRYRDERVSIRSETLVVDGSGGAGATARFQEVSEVLFLESGDRISCSSITYFLESGYTQFTGEALFRQGAGETSPLVVQARVMRYHPDTGILLCAGEVLALKGAVSVRAPAARYLRDEEAVLATGGVTVRRNGDLVRGVAARLDLPTGSVELQDEVEGSFRLAGDAAREEGAGP